MDAHAEICRAIDQYKDKAVSLSHQIHEKPELKFQEHFAAGLLSGAARELGLPVETGSRRPRDGVSRGVRQWRRTHGCDPRRV